MSLADCTRRVGSTSRRAIADVLRSARKLLVTEEGRAVERVDERAQDQARLPVFRLLLLVQVAAAGFFGLAPLLIPGQFAAWFGYSGDDELVYRLAGAASTGYAVAAVYALATRGTWGELRIPVVATLTFNVAAVVAAALTITTGERGILPWFILVAAGLFSLISAWWVWRNAGPPAPARRALDGGFRVVLGLATLSAAVFGFLPLFVPGTFASLFGLAGTDTFIYRLAGAATIGYAAAGLIEVSSPTFGEIRIQNLAAITFNALGAVASILALTDGRGGLLAPVVAVAATFFAVALAWLSTRTS
jgi:hypothetical protein